MALTHPDHRCPHGVDLPGNIIPQYPVHPPDSYYASRAWVTDLVESTLKRLDPDGVRDLVNEFLHLVDSEKVMRLTPSAGTGTIPVFNQVGQVVGTSVKLSDLPDPVTLENLLDSLESKVDKVEGKGLSTNDFTEEYKTKLDGLGESDVKVDTTLTEEGAAADAYTVGQALQEQEQSLSTAQQSVQSIGDEVRRLNEALTSVTDDLTSVTQTVNQARSLTDLFVYGSDGNPTEYMLATTEELQALESQIQARVTSAELSESLSPIRESLAGKADAQTVRTKYDLSIYDVSGTPTGGTLASQTYVDRQVENKRSVDDLAIYSIIRMFASATVTGIPEPWPDDPDHMSLPSGFEDLVNEAFRTGDMYVQYTGARSDGLSTSNSDYGDFLVVYTPGLEKIGVEKVEIVGVSDVITETGETAYAPSTVEFSFVSGVYEGYSVGPAHISVSVGNLVYRIGKDPTRSLVDSSQLQGFRTKEDLQVYSAGVPVDGQTLVQTSELEAVEAAVEEVADSIQELGTSVGSLGGDLSNVKGTISRLREKSDMTIYDSEGSATEDQIALRSWVQTYLSERYENGEETYYGS